MLCVAVFQQFLSSIASLEGRANLKKRDMHHFKILLNVLLWLFVETASPQFATYVNFLLNKQWIVFGKKTKVQNEASAFSFPLHIHLSFYWLWILLFVNCKWLEFAYTSKPLLGIDTSLLYVSDVALTNYRITKGRIRLSPLRNLHFW